MNTKVRNYALAYLLLRERHPNLAARFYCRYWELIDSAFRLTTKEKQP